VRRRLLAVAERRPAMRATTLMSVLLVSACIGLDALAQCDPKEVAKLLASDAAANDYFGSSVSVSGDAAVVGAWRDDDRGPESGSAYVYDRVGGVWTQTAKLLASDSGAGDWFGLSVAISGDTAVVGARYDDDLGEDSGSAYVFERVGGVWTQKAKLLASDGAEDDFFGHSVSLSGDTALVGAWGDDDRWTDSGSAYVFERVGGVWTQKAKLLAPDGAVDDRFGSSVSISGDTALVGAYGDDDRGPDSGSAYVFERVGGVWTQRAKLLASDGAAGDEFGISVAVSGDAAVVGAHLDDDRGTWCGSAYVFERVGGVWTQKAKLFACDGAAADYFGESVSISGDTAVVGAYGDDDRGDRSGSAYVFDLHCGCAADFNGDGVVDTRDVIAFLNAWAEGC